MKRVLKLVTFGDANISFLNVPVANLSQSIQLTKRANNRRYAIETNGHGMVSIEYDANDTFTVGLFNNSRWITSLSIDPMAIDIGNTVRAHQAQVSTRHVTQNEARNVYTTFKVENRSEVMLKRLDVLGHGMKWFSVFSHNANLLMVRPNGDWVAEKMLYLIDQTTTQAINNYRRTNGQEVLPSAHTAVMRRRESIAQSPMPAKLTADTATQTIEGDVPEIQLLKDERLYERRAYLLYQNDQRLRELKTKYEAELLQLRPLEERLNRLNEEEQFYAQRKIEIANALVELGQAGNVLYERRTRLQEETAQFEKEMAELEDARNARMMSEPPKLTTSQQTQTEPLLQMLHHATSIPLSQRIGAATLEFKRMMMANDGNMTIVRKVTSKE